ncbi:hypothetical protein SADUNF_Sadunf04G0023500 [Salix dunnii]|uniref:Uncharacterized protein n=1 Tax=Salix dunnii TaxID=1413687 RepID=A0A835KA46_9ROSI|nr:hypothetical protein SADUNF_Sadunf04G0023500 [Salix dunnii]
MGLIGSLGCMNSYSKKQCMALFWRLKAAVRTVKRNGRKKRFKFQYDPSSYALNFDDGCCKLGASGYAVKHDNATINDSKEMLWVYVLSTSAVRQLNSRKHHSSKCPASQLSQRTNQARVMAPWP